MRKHKYAQRHGSFLTSREAAWYIISVVSVCLGRRHIRQGRQFPPYLPTCGGNV